MHFFLVVVLCWGAVNHHTLYPGLMLQAASEVEDQIRSQQQV